MTNDGILLPSIGSRHLNNIAPKHSLTDSIIASGYKPTFGECSRTGFTASRQAVISPYSYDPGPTSDANIIRPDGQCPIYDRFSNGSVDYVFVVSPQSLRDIGTHTFKCTIGWVANTSTCSPCISSCLSQTTTSYFEYDVINFTPSASPTWSPASPAWNSFITFNANASDYDGGPLVYRWVLLSRPPQSTASMASPWSANPTLSLGSERDIGTWKYRLEVDDDEGEMMIYPFEFTVPNVPPNFEFSGLTEVVVNTPLGLGSTRTTDDDGGDLTFIWDILQTPAQSSQRPQNNYSTASSISISTTKTDIGEWVFRLTATDNEGASVSKTVTVKVVNAKPRIVFSGPAEIDAGQSLLVSTTVLQDDDGGALSFKWEVVQQPGSTGTPLPYVVSTTSTVSKPSLWTYGTWIFRLTATDDEDESVQGEFEVLVDASPWVYAMDINGNEAPEPEYALIVNRGDPLLLDSWAEDPDSPCPDSSHRCHRTDGRPVSISQDIVRYQWNIIQIPPDINDRGYMDYYPEAPGPVHSYFYGVADDGPDLDFDFYNIPEGLWGFELRAWDAEGNESTSPLYLQVQQPSVPPSTSVSSSLPYVYSDSQSRYRVTTSLYGTLPSQIAFYGWAADWDNKDPYDPYYQDIEPWLGIINQQWQAIPPTPACVVPPFSQWERSAVLYPSGAIVTPDCQGRWRMRFIAYDDDQTTKSTTEEYTFFIGNCNGKVCLDSPKQTSPAVLSTEGTGGVFLSYHIDSALYDETVFGLGVYTKLEIFLEDNTLDPIYSAVSGPATQTSRGWRLLLYWNGLTQSGTRVPEGKYFNVKVSLLDANSNVLGSQTEYRAISSEPLKAVFNEPPTKYVRAYATDTMTMSFTLTGALSPVDYFQGRLRDSLGNLVKTSTASASANSISINCSTYPGRYTFELVAMRGGIAFTVATHPIVIYQYQIQPAWSVDPQLGFQLLVNNDDDNLNGVKDLEESQLAGDDEVVALNVRLLPALDGTLSVEHTFGEGVLKVWETSSKSGEISLPKTWNIPENTAPSKLYVEPLKDARGEVLLSFTSADGTIFPTSSLELNTVLVEAIKDFDGNHVIDDEDIPLGILRAARWDNAYNITTTVNADGGVTEVVDVINDADPSNFVEQDPSRFYIRARGPSLDLDPSKADTLSFKADVIGSPGDGNFSPFQLTENGVNTSVLVSRSHMMTGRDIEGIPLTDTDDGYPVHDGVNQVVADNAVGDRTWRSSIDGYLRLISHNQQWRIPICGPERRKVKLRVHVFLEPYRDIGIDTDGNPNTTHDRFGVLNGKFDYVDENGNWMHDLGEQSEPYLDLSNPLDGNTHSGDDPDVISARGQIVPFDAIWRELRHTDSLWAPACIKTELVYGRILVAEAPKYKGVNILLDGVIRREEFGAVYDAFGDTMEEDVIDVFYGSVLYWGKFAGGIATPPLFQPDDIEHGEKLFTIIESNQSTYPALAHELAHLLTNTEDSAGNSTYFYPTKSAPMLTTVKSSRRMPEWVVQYARTSRAYKDYISPGNRLLIPY